MTASEKRWVWTLSLVILAITTIPYALGYWTQGGAWRFTGFFMGVEDGNSYIAKMLIGTSGEWLFRTPYTAYPQNGFMAFVPYFLLGKLVSPPGQHEQLVALFQVFRWLGGWLMSLATYRFIAFFVENPRLRKLGTLLAILGGGLGWLALLGLQPMWGERIPLEFYSPETFGFLSLFTLPHLALGRALLLLGILAYWRAYETPPSNSKMLLNGLLWLGLGLMQPLTVLIAWMVVGLDFVIRVAAWRWGWFETQNWKGGMINAAVMITCSAPVAIYTAVSFLSDPFLKDWSGQNIILSPPPGDYLMAYGLLLPFVYLGVRQILKLGRGPGWTLLGWGALLPVLAYFPYNLQRRLPEGIWVVLVVLAMLGLSKIKGRWAVLSRVVLFSSFVMTLMIFAGSLLSLFQVKAPIYRAADEVRAFEFLQTSVRDFPVVLAAYDTANAMPAWAAVHTVIGHGPESVHLKELKPRVEAFFRAETSPEERKALLQEFRIQYVFWGPEERSSGSWDPASMPELERIYQNTTCQVFRVCLSCGTKTK